MRRSGIVRNDLGIYERHAADWWNADSKAFRSLHRVNAFRVELLQRWLGGALPGATVVDLGCGGGLLAEALGRRGARVVGIDASRASVGVALQHARQERVVGCAYVHADLSQAPLRSGCAEFVLLADVLEHVRDVGDALREAARLLVPGGKLFVNTINRTWRSRLLAVTLAEGLGLVPRGTHDPHLFVTPQRLTQQAAERGLRLLQVQGESTRLWATLRSRAIELRESGDRSVTYSALFEKENAR